MQQPEQFLNWVLHWIRVLSFRVFCVVIALTRPWNLHPLAATAAAILPMLPDDVYKMKRRDRFVSWFDQQHSNNNNNNNNNNENVDACFFPSSVAKTRALDKQATTTAFADYKAQVLPKDNPLELRWRKRLLMEFTPRGLVLMYYDAFKRGFAYYSDTHMPYGILNAAAMKYVMTYRCQAFFVDEEYYVSQSQQSQHDYTSPLLQLEHEEEDIATKKHVKPSNGKPTPVGPFLKPKPTTTTTTTTTTTIAGQTSDTAAAELQKIARAPAGCGNSPVLRNSPVLHKNRFIHLGKLVNHKMLPSPPSVHKANPFAAAAAAAAPMLSYAEYKFWQTHGAAAATASQVLDDMQ